MRRWRWALLGSVLLHLGLALWLWRRPGLVIRPPSVATAEPVEVLLLEAAPPVAPVAPAPARPPVAPPARRRPRVTSLPAPAVPAQPDPVPPREDGAPLARSLVPSGDVVPIIPEPGRGHTVYNVPVDREAELAATGEAVRRRVQGWAEDELATARVTSGLLPPYFSELRRELTAGLVNPPAIFDAKAENTEQLKAWAGQLKRSWEVGARNYAATGSPYPEAPGKSHERPSMLEADAQRLDEGARIGLGTIAQGNRLRELGEGRAGLELVVIVELEHASDGSLVSAVMLKGSGVKPFDLWVMRSAEIGLDAVKELPPDGGARSVWEFRGRVSYMRSVKDFDVKEDLWYVLPMAAVGMLPGTFDEVLGTAQYVDLRRPHYEATVRLLRAY